MPAVKQFHDLQEIDLRLAGLTRSLNDVRTRLADDSALVTARERTSRLEAQLEDLASKRRASERAISLLQEGLKGIESRLYGGAVTNEREMSAAEKERSAIVGRQSEEEDTLLELMVGMEDVEGEQREARQALERIEAERPRERAQLTSEQERLAGELAGAGLSRDRLVPLLPAGSLSLYESLRKSKGGRAVAKVQQGLCQGCRVSLTTMELQKARSTQEIVQCSSCGRILYLT